MPLKVLVLGSGGREHALAWRLAQSPSVGEVHAAPGNPGIARVAQCYDVNPKDARAVCALARSLAADLTVVGPEAPLVAGVADALRAEGLRVVGPGAEAAQLEGSKIFAKNFMAEYGIPTAGFATANSLAEATAALERFDYPVVLKADGLAAGKGVIIATGRAEALTAAESLISGAHVGEAGSRLVIEEFLTGEEVSFIAVCDGEWFVALRPTQDHKAVYDGDLGPNTGGMGAYADPRLLSPASARQIEQTVIEPVLAGMRHRGTPFSGFLYAGLMLTGSGPKVLEFNVRMGDPETQPLMHSLEGDWGEFLLAAAEGRLEGQSLAWSPQPSVCVVLAAEGYPSRPRTGDAITGIDAAERTGAQVFHAGTRLREGVLETAGGRVLGVTASGEGLAGAIAHAYRAVEQIRFAGMHYRRDIGAKGLKRWG